MPARDAQGRRRPATVRETRLHGGLGRRPARSAAVGHAAYATMASIGQLPASPEHLQTATKVLALDHLRQSRRRNRQLNPRPTTRTTDMPTACLEQGACPDRRVRLRLLPVSTESMGRGRLADLHRQGGRFHGCVRSNGIFTTLGVPVRFGRSPSSSTPGPGCRGSAGMQTAQRHGFVWREGMFGTDRCTATTATAPIRIERPREVVRGPAWTRPATVTGSS